MSNQLVGAVLAAVIPFAIVGASRLTGHWFGAEWLPQDRIEKGYRERERLLMMADQLAEDGETAWADEWRRTARARGTRSGKAGQTISFAMFAHLCPFVRTRRRLANRFTELG